MNTSTNADSATDGTPASQESEDGTTVDVSVREQGEHRNGRSTAITDEDVFEVLSNRRRRYALHYLHQHSDEPVEMGDLSTQVAAWEVGASPDQLTYEQRKRVHTSLYQYHAPKLHDKGLIEYDSRRGVLELTDAGVDLDLYLEAVSDDDVPWAVYFLGLSLLGTALMTVAWLDLVPEAVVPDVAFGGFVVAAFLVSSAVFVYDTRVSMRLGSPGPPTEVARE